MHIYASLLSVHDRDAVKEWKRVERYVDGVHIDVADGLFVSHKTRFTPQFARTIKTRKWKDVHLMVRYPERYVGAYVRAGAQEIDIHFETLKMPAHSLRSIKKRFPKVVLYLAVNATTPARAIIPLIPFLDGVLCMTQEKPGTSGEKFASRVLKKIRVLRRYALKLPIMVDGGINAETARLARNAGATIVVSGSYLFRSDDAAYAAHSLRV